ncbi:10213_t:CDS:2 [Gigaspora margarita]|uniref:10213_t:CDS:1 n=1 Tax=Gigaspora margarita TaxID=4874 RepID=A0ABN7VC72_GIGMA|nr:10213_t:CDS:2 [Gigaspora margarita]
MHNKDERDDGLTIVAVQENEELGFSEEKLHEEGRFKSWEEALNTITIYAQQEGFGLRKGHSEKMSDGPTKDNPLSNVYITTLSNTHNHSLSPNRERFFNGIEFIQEICERVEFYINVIKLKPLQIKKALEKEFSDHKIYLSEKQKDLSNDAASLYENLLRKKEEDPHCNIILNDNTTKTNRYDMALLLFLCINNHGLSQLVECALMDNESADSYQWKTQILLTSSVITLPQVLFPEIDKALSHFLIPAMLKVQRLEIKSCLNYQASSITKAELMKYQEGLLSELQEDVLVDSSDKDDGEMCSNNSDDSNDNEEDKENDQLVEIISL